MEHIIKFMPQNLTAYQSENISCSFKDQLQMDLFFSNFKIKSNGEPKVVESPQLVISEFPWENWAIKMTIMVNPKSDPKNTFLKFTQNIK